MAINWVEDIVSHWYKLRGYIVLENEDLPMPEGESGRAEADIIAINDKELVHVECMAGWWPGRQDEEALQRLNNKFERVRDPIFEKYNFLDQANYKIIKIFVTSGRPRNPQPNSPWVRLQNFCNEKNIELKEINTIIEDLIKELRNKYPLCEQQVGQKGIARFLLHLIHNDFLKR